MRCSAFRAARRVSAGHAPRRHAIVYLAVLSSCLKYGVEELEWIDENPALRVKRGREGRGRMRRLTAKETKDLFKACKRSDWDGLYTLVSLALHTGARLGEILCLEWRDVDLTSREIDGETIHGLIALHDTKNGSARTLGVIARLADDLRAHRVRQMAKAAEEGSYHKTPLSLVTLAS